MRQRLVCQYQLDCALIQRLKFNAGASAQENTMTQSAARSVDAPDPQGGVEKPDSSKNKPRPSLKPLLTLLPFIKPYRRYAALALVFLLISATATLTLPNSVGKMIDHGFSQADAAFVDKYFFMLFALAGVLAVASAARYYFVTRIGEQVIADLRRAVYAHLLRQEQAFFEVTKSGELLSRLTTDTELVQTLIGSALSMALRHFLMLIGSLVLLVLASPKLSLLIMVGIPLVIAPIFLIGRRVQRLSRDSQDKIAETSGVAGEALNAVHTVQAFAREHYEAQRYSRSVLALFDAAKQRIRARALLIGLVILIVFGAITCVIWVGAKAVLAGSMSGGELTQFVLYAVVAAGATGALTEVWGDVQRAAGAMGRLSELLTRQPLIGDPAQPVTLLTKLRGDIAFKSVNFCYPSRPDANALTQLNLKIQQGETVALVGRSGAGKSTIFQLLLRFYEPQSGALEIQGMNIADMPLALLRENIAIVPQDAVIFGGTIGENIRYGRLNATDAEVERAAEQAEAMEFIRQLPQGLNTQVGERGVRLSGGQQQRIAIARAILKDAPILLLDEATSALDAQSERAVQIALERLMQGRTTLVIAHRLATVVRADRIVVLANGAIIDQGTHTELTGREGVYAELARLQFSAH
jgi:ATP-binding cassette, subfamily B, bacterial